MRVKSNCRELFKLSFPPQSVSGFHPKREELLSGSLHLGTLLTNCLRVKKVEISSEEIRREYVAEMKDGYYVHIFLQGSIYHVHISETYSSKEEDFRACLLDTLQEAWSSDFSSESDFSSGELSE